MEFRISSKKHRELIGKKPPHDPALERAVLASIVLKPDCFAEVSAIVGSADFFDSLHGRIFVEMTALARDGKPIDVRFLLPRLKPQDEVATSAAGLIAELLREQPTAVHAFHYAQRVADLAKRRRLLTLAEEMIVGGHGDKPIDTLLTDAAERLQAIGAGPRAPTSQPVLVRLSDVQPQPVQWLWPGRIGLGKLTLLVGDPGLGKSSVSLDLAARVSLGSPWPDDRTVRAPLGSVVLLNAEDTLADVVRPRLDSLGADVQRIVALQAVRAEGGDSLTFSLQRDLPALEQAIKAAGDCRLVVVDPVSAYLGQTDSHKNADIRALLAPLCDLADRAKVAVIAVTHLNKGTGGSAIYRATGSLAFVAAARAAWLAAKDPDNPRRRLFLPVKNNLAGDTLGMAYTFRDGVVEWEPEPVAIDADAALATVAQSEQGADEAADWLRQALADGPVSATPLLNDAQANGISPKQLRAAKKRVGAKSRKAGFGAAGGWEWYLTEAEGSKEAQWCPSEGLGIYGHLRESIETDGQPDRDQDEVMEWSA